MRPAHRHRHLTFVVLLAVAVGLGSLAPLGCGKDDGSTTAERSDSEPATAGADSDSGPEANSETEGNSIPKGADEPAPPIDKIAVPKAPEGADDSIQTFGEEAGAKESAEIAAVATRFLEAQARGDAEAACFYLTEEAKEALAELVASAPEGSDVPSDCESLLEELFAATPRAQRSQLAKITVGSVRVEGEQAFVVYRGARGLWFGLSVREEDGEWRVNNLSGAQLPV